MSEVIKPTPGPWVVNHAGSASAGKPFKIDEFYVYAPGLVTDVALCSDVIDPLTNEPNESNARLIAEAGTVFHETQCTPRQLAEQRDQLVERVKELEDVARALVAYDEAEHEDHVLLMLDYADMLKAARAALSKALPNTVAEVK